MTEQREGIGEQEGDRRKGMGWRREEEWRIGKRMEKIRNEE